MTNQIVLLLVLLLLSGFFSSAETALFSISRSKARYLAKQKGRANYLINHMKNDQHRLLSTILIGNNVVNIAASTIAAKIAIQLFPDYAIWLATFVMTFLILVFGEVFPKSVATRNNVLIARMVIIPLYWFSLLCRPIVFFLDFIPKLTGRIKRTPSVTEEELMTFVEVVREEGEINEEEHKLIHRIFEFDDTNASEIMTPRADMFVIDANESLDLKAITESGFTRIPVIEKSIDNVVGILNIKDLLMHQASGNNTPPDVRQLMRPPYFVPEHKKLDSLLRQFKKRKNHMAIVVDEHGGVSGLITLEDALEELVGEIRDETDKEERLITKRKPQEWLVMGKTDIEMVNEYIGMGIPDSAEYDTFSGYVLEQIGRIPSEKEEFTFGEYQVMVKSMDGNRIREFVVQQIEKSRSPAELAPPSK